MTIWLLLASSSFLVQHLVMSKHKSVCQCLWLHWDVYSELSSWDIVASLGIVTRHFELMVFPFVKQRLCLNTQILFVNVMPQSLLAPLLVPTGRWMAQLWNVCIKSRAYCMPGPCLPPLLLRVFVFECGFCLLCICVCRGCCENGSLLALLPSLACSSCDHDSSSVSSGSLWICREIVFPLWKLDPCTTGNMVLCSRKCLKEVKNYNAVLTYSPFKPRTQN